MKINLATGEDDPITEIVFSDTPSSDAQSLEKVLHDDGDGEEQLVIIKGEGSCITISYKRDAELMIAALNKALELGWWNDGDS